MVYWICNLFVDDIFLMCLQRYGKKYNRRKQFSKKCCFAIFVGFSCKEIKCPLQILYILKQCLLKKIKKIRVYFFMLI